MIKITVKDGQVKWQAKGDPISITQDIKALAKQLKKCGFEMDEASWLVFSNEAPEEIDKTRTNRREKK